MISFIRRFIDSKIGLAVIFIFLGIIAFAFAAGDITGVGGMANLSGRSDTLAKVGGRTLTGTELTERIQNIYRQQREQNPQITLSQMIAQGAFEGVMNQLSGGLALAGFADDQGVVISKRMIDGEIASIPLFQDPGGGFSETNFRRGLQRLQITEPALREDIERQKIARQLLVPSTLDAVLPDSLVLPYASLLLEVRQGRIVGVPSKLLVTQEVPDEKALAAFYARTGQAYLLPEQRSVRYAAIDLSNFEKAAQPSDGDVAAFYNSHKADYAARQTRSVEQLVVLTEAAARTIAAAVAKGETLSAVAKKSGLSTSNLADQTQAALTGKVGADLSRQVFAASNNTTVGPIKTPLGWTLVKVTTINNVPAKSLDQARASIVTGFSAEKSRSLLGDLLRKIDDQAHDGATFDDIVKDHKLTVVTTPPLLKDGKSLANPAFAGDADLKGVLPAAFDVDPSGDAVLAQLVPDKRFALVDVVDVVPAAPPPLAKVRDEVVEAYKLDIAQKKARAIADAIQAKVNGGKDLAAAAAETGLALRPPESFGGQRATVMRTPDVPPPLVLLFSMGQGDTKVLSLKGSDGFVVVHLDKILAGDVRTQPDLLGTTRAELQKVVGFEHADQLEKAIEKEMGLKTFPETVARVKADLARAGSGG